MKMHNERKITKGGSITIPSYVRRQLNYDAGKPLTIEIEDNGDIRLIAEKLCALCGSREKVITRKGLSLCSSCISDFSEEV